MRGEWRDGGLGAGDWGLAVRAVSGWRRAFWDERCLPAAVRGRWCIARTVAVAGIGSTWGGGRGFSLWGARYTIVIY
jgi:hypothetical protein